VNIRTQANVMAVASTLMLVAVLAVSAFYFLELQRITAQTQAVTAMNQSLTQLRFVTLETIVYPSPRLAVQWQRRYQGIGLMLNNAAFSESKEIALLDRIRSNYTVLDTLYTRLIDNAQKEGGAPSERDRRRERVARTVTSLLGATQEMLDDVADLSRLNQSDNAVIQRSGQLMSLGIAVAAGLMAGWFTLLIRKRVLIPIAVMEQGIGVISAGQLDYRLNLPAANEIGRLADAFDAMTTKLQESYRQITESEAFQRSTFDEAPDAVLLVASSGKIVRANYEAERMFGCPRSQLTTLMVEDLMPADKGQSHAAFREFFFAMPRRRAMGSGRQLIGQRIDGSTFPVDVMLSPLRQSVDDLVIVTIRDITERRQAEAQVNALNNRLSLATQAGGIGVWEWNLLTNTLVWDERMYALYKVSPSASMHEYSQWRQHVHPDDLERVDAEVQAALTGQKAFTTEFRIIWPDGQVRTIRADGVISEDDAENPVYMTGINWDITESKQKEAAINAALRDKETLLKELYHRVKNNLQVITSLFNLQARTVPEGIARIALKEGADRVRAMALVHEKFYQSRTLASIALDEYIVDLCQQLGNAAAAKQRGIALVIKAQPIQVGLETAVPLGLLLNELLSNCLKHAFPDNRPGTITVSLARTVDDTAELAVSDNGIGFPSNFDLTSSHFLGLKLVTALSTQLDGSLSLETKQGAYVRLSFRLADRNHAAGKTRLASVT
jgi:PAS domain S-box-containing protein